MPQNDLNVAAVVVGGGIGPFSDPKLPRGYARVKWGLILVLGGTELLDANIALFSGILGDRLGKNPRYASMLQWLTGCVLVGLGLRLAFSGRQ